MVCMLAFNSDLLPANPSSITFTNIAVNGIVPPWTPRTGSNDCGQKVAKIGGNQVNNSITHNPCDQSRIIHDLNEHRSLSHGPTNNVHISNDNQLSTRAPWSVATIIITIWQYLYRCRVIGACDRPPSTVSSAMHQCHRDARMSICISLSCSSTCHMSPCL